MNDADFAVELSSSRTTRLRQRRNPASSVIVVGSRRALILLLSCHETLLSVELEVLVTTSRVASRVIGREECANFASSLALRRTHSPLQVKARWAGRLIFADLAIEEAGLTRRGFLRYTSRTIKVRANRAVWLGLMSTDIILHGIAGRARWGRFANAVTV